MEYDYDTIKEKKIVFTSIACCSGNSLQSWLPDGLIQTPAQEKKNSLNRKYEWHPKH